MDKLTEVIDEFRENVFRQGGWLDLLPPLVFFLAFRYLEFKSALVLTLLLLAIILFSRFKTRSFSFWTVLGLFGLGLALFYAWRLGNLSGLLIPDIITDLVFGLLSLLSLIFKRPLVAYTSHFVRRWPLGWYWHPRIKPAYREVTLIWGFFFLIRFVGQWFLFQANQSQNLFVFNFLTGWPALVILLVASYLYGLWRLGRLSGPSVKEYEQKKEPPWRSQQKGF